MVVYLVCYDLSAAWEVQNNQRSYWLDFLQSTLPSPPDTRSKWRVIVVGTKSDESSNTKVPSDSTLSWQHKWHHLPLHHQHLTVSSFKMNGIQALTKVLEQVCGDIFKQHATLIPKIFKSLLQSIQTIPQDLCITSISHLKATFWRESDKQFNLALRYLHSIGQIIVLGGSLVCTAPQVIPKITAEFISPEQVRGRLSTNYEVEILDEKQIGMVLKISDKTTKYATHSVLDYSYNNNLTRLRDKLAIMESIGVCFKLAICRGVLPMYLFPSLASFSGIHLTYLTSNFINC